MPQPTPAKIDDSATPISFPSVGRKKLTAAFDGGRLTSDGGVLLLAQAERAMGICGRLAACIADRRDPTRVTHKLDDILRARILAICCGYEDAAVPCPWRRAAIVDRVPTRGVAYLGHRDFRRQFEPVMGQGVAHKVDAHRDRDDPAVLAHFHISRVDPQVGPVALDRAIEEGADALVDLFAQAADLALGDTRHAKRVTPFGRGLRRPDHRPKAYRPNTLRRLGYRLPGSPPSAPSLPSGAVPESRGNNCPCAIWGCAVRQSRRGCASQARGDRCVGQTTHPTMQFC